ncbi:restriction endonuclease subunit S [Bacteroides ovatus]|uniref:restriction endonuclease subunit S n=1 Tax=Bacteroides ovatus TaxID=28116 RepID=UPI0011059F22|nr:restriction endonuclease subunit S [Bacteroides ovatus]MDC2571542.1 restriction endonuclease subunit S [Bacteroides ovatus]MDC2575579.1 restriction endonuclease subunit S [Bacteroides ovatus]MDC2590735.1 restriction endonuclease subunit S [Bacteroides ovatus]
MNGKQLKNSILQWAIQGKLVPQDPNDEPASVLLDKIRQEKERLIKEKKIKRDKNASIIYRGEDNSYYEKVLATGEVKCIDEEVPFEIPKGWEWCRLGEISTYAQTKRKINASNADSQLWGLDLEDIEKGGRLLNIKTVGERKAIGDKTVFNRGDILYSKLRPYLLKILVAPEGGICTPEIIPFTCYGNICKDYIVSFLKSPYVDDYINSATFGVKMPRVSTETMTSLLVPLPPLSEQFRIDTKAKELMPYIDEYGKAQDKLNKLNEELSYSIRKSILQEAIQGKLVPQIAEEGTAQELLEQIKTEKQKLVKEGKLKKSTLATSVIFRGDDNKYYEQIGSEITEIDLPFEFPSSWSIARLNAVCQLTDGLKTTGKQCLLDAKYLRGKSSETIVEHGKFVYKGDNIMLVDGENSGEVFIVPQDGYMGSTFKQLWISSSMYEPYILAFIQFYKETLRNSKKGAAIPHLNKELFYGLIIGIPPLQEQRRVVQKIEQSSKLLK